MRRRRNPTWLEIDAANKLRKERKKSYRNTWPEIRSEAQWHQHMVGMQRIYEGFVEEQKEKSEAAQEHIRQLHADPYSEVTTSIIFPPEAGKAHERDPNYPRRMIVFAAKLGHQIAHDFARLALGCLEKDVKPYPPDADTNVVAASIESACHDDNLTAIRYGWDVFRGSGAPERIARALYGRAFSEQTSDERDLILDLVKTYEAWLADPGGPRSDELRTAIDLLFLAIRAALQNALHDVRAILTSYEWEQLTAVIHPFLGTDYRAICHKMAECATHLAWGSRMDVYVPGAGMWASHTLEAPLPSGYARDESVDKMRFFYYLLSLYVLKVRS